MSSGKSASISPELLKLDGKPSLSAAFPQALQHVLAMLAGNITPPILIATQLELPAEERILLMQAAMIIGGITTLIQLFPIFGFGMGLPNVMGVAFAYMPILSAIGMAYGIKAIFGAQLIGALSSIPIGMCIGHIRKFFPPVVSGTVVLSIGLSLYGTAITYMAGGSTAGDNLGHPKYWIVAIVVLFTTLACNFFGKGYLKLSGMLVGMGSGYILSILFDVAGILPVTLADGSIAKMVDFSKIADASAFSFPSILHWGLEFPLPAIFSMILMYIVQAVQTIGDVSSTAIGGFNREATNKELGGAIMGQGLCGMIGACIGGLPTDPYSQNVGIIVTTKVVAKRVFVIVGALMLLAGFSPVFGAAMTTIPYPVLGGATITVFAAITMSGVALIKHQPLNYRNKMIVGISLALGVGINTVRTSLQFFPKDIQDIFGSSPIVLAFLTAFLLNIIVPQDDSAED